MAINDDEPTPPSHPASAREGTKDNLSLKISTSSKTLRKVLAAVLQVGLAGLTGLGGHQIGASAATKRIDELEKKLDEHVKDEADSDKSRDAKLVTLETEIARELGSIDAHVGDVGKQVDALSGRFDAHLAAGDGNRTVRARAVTPDDP